MVISVLASFLHFLGENLFLYSQDLHWILVFESEYTSFQNTDTDSGLGIVAHFCQFCQNYIEKDTLLLSSLIRTMEAWRHQKPSSPTNGKRKELTWKKKNQDDKKTISDDFLSSRSRLFETFYLSWNLFYFFKVSLGFFKIYSYKTKEIPLLNMWLEWLD